MSSFPKIDIQIFLVLKRLSLMSLIDTAFDLDSRVVFFNQLSLVTMRDSFLELRFFLTTSFRKSMLYNPFNNYTVFNTLDCNTRIL